MSKTQVSPNSGGDPQQSDLAANPENVDPLADLTPYQRYVRRRQQRETMVFTVIGSVMAGLLVLSILIGFGILPFPFLTTLSRHPNTPRRETFPVRPRKKRFP